MKRIYIQETENLDLTGKAGITLIGAALERFTTFRKDINSAYKKQKHGIPCGDIATVYIAALTTGKSDFEAVRQFASSSFYEQALNVKQVPSPETARQHLDVLATTCLSITHQASLDLIRNSGCPISRNSFGYTVLDIDPSPHDNSRTHKEGVSYTYKGMDGYTPNYAYLGEEGWCIGAELRPGSQNGQKDSPAFFRQAIHDSRSLGAKSLLIRTDSGFDAAENYVLAKEENVDILVKQNFRQDPIDCWKIKAIFQPDYKWIKLYEGCDVMYFEETTSKQWSKPRPDGNGSEKVTVELRHVIRVKRLRTWIEKTENGPQPLIPFIDNYQVDGWWTTLSKESPCQVVELYEAHGTSEQFHSELKGELDLERLPSGKFATNALVLAMGVLAYNLLKTLSLIGDDAFSHRAPAKRRRMKTIIQELILLPARICRSGHRLILDLGGFSQIGKAFRRLYNRLFPPRWAAIQAS